jgi:uncharacterized protein (TIGR01777 family)
MNTHLLALQLMAFQGCLGAFDTLYHHELTEALPSRPGARLELAIHAVRSLFYCALFIGLALWRFEGGWALALLIVFAIEIGLTLWDFVVEDRTRLLPWTERITHTVLAMNGGAFVMLLLLNTPAWMARPTALVWQHHGLLSVFLCLCGIGVGISGVRDAFAARALARRCAHDGPVLNFADGERSFLVTGATGFIGQKLVRALLRDGHRVTILARQVRQAAWLFDGRVDCISSMEQLPPARRIDVVINLAGAPVLGWRWTAARRNALRASRIELTRKVVAWIAAAEHKPQLLLSASAIGYYGIQQPGDEAELTENAPPHPVFMSDLCRDWEAVAQSAGAHGVQVACMRLGLVLGDKGALPMMLLPVKLGLGGPLGGGRQWLSWMHVDDVLGAVAHLCRTRQGGIFNFTAPEAVSQAQFSRTAARVHRRPWGFPTPGFPMRWALGEQADLLLEGQRVAPMRLKESGFRFAYPALDGALESLA